jgi:hypothetical protein
MLHSRVQFSSTAALPPTLFLADYIINIAEFEFSIGTATERANGQQQLPRTELLELLRLRNNHVNADTTFG